MGGARPVRPRWLEAGLVPAPVQPLAHVPVEPAAPLSVELPCGTRRWWGMRGKPPSLRNSSKPSKPLPPARHVEFFRFLAHLHRAGSLRHAGRDQYAACPRQRAAPGGGEKRGSFCLYQQALPSPQGALLGWNWLLAPDKTAGGRAITYALGHWEKLLWFLQDGRVQKQRAAFTASCREHRHVSNDHSPDESSWPGSPHFSNGEGLHFGCWQKYSRARGAGPYRLDSAKVFESKTSKSVWASPVPM